MRIVMAGIVALVGLGCRSHPPTPADVVSALEAHCGGGRIEVTFERQREDLIAWSWSFDGVRIFGTEGRSVKVGGGWEHRFDHPRMCPPPFPQDAISDARAREIAGQVGSAPAPERVYDARFVQVARVPGSQNAADYDNVLDGFRPAMFVHASPEAVVVDARSGEILRRMRVDKD